ncbi:MAG TPA: hypothetical protein VF787_13515 [Thermoanaerobaculia bacterium]
MTSVAAVAQTPTYEPSGRPYTGSVEANVKSAAMRFAERKEIIDKDIRAMAGLRAADKALTDPTQPGVAIEKAFERVDPVSGLTSDFLVRQGAIRVRQELEAARRSPSTADFGRLRAILQEEAIGPAVRVIARHGAELSEETMKWLALQELIAAHLRQLTETSAEALRATQ